MLWHRCLWNPCSSRLNARSQTNWAILDQAEHLNSIAIDRPYDRRVFRPLDTTAGCLWHWLWWHTCLLLLILMLKPMVLPCENSLVATYTNVMAEDPGSNPSGWNPFSLIAMTYDSVGFTCEEIIITIKFLLRVRVIPLNTCRNDYVVVTTKRRHFDIIMSKWHRFHVTTASLLRNVSSGIIIISSHNCFEF